LASCVAIAVLAGTASAADPVADAQIACERNLDACAEYDRLVAEKRAADLAHREAEIARDRVRAAAAQEEHRQQSAASRSRSAALRSECGRDYRRPRIGQTLERLKKCNGGARLRAEGPGGQIWTTGSGAEAHVVDGRVVTWAQ